jgi:hypothetical protein
MFRQSEGICSISVWNCPDRVGVFFYINVWNCVGAVPNINRTNTLTLSEQFQTLIGKIPPLSEQFQTLKETNTPTLLEQFQTFRQSEGICSISVWNCSDRVGVFFILVFENVPTE